MSIMMMMMDMQGNKVKEERAKEGRNRQCRREVVPARHSETRLSFTHSAQTVYCRKDKLE